MHRRHGKHAVHESMRHQPVRRVPAQPAGGERPRSLSASVALRIFVWAHVMGVAVYLVHGAFWLLAVAAARLAGDGSPQMWPTLRLTDGGVLVRWVIGIVTLCFLLAAYRKRLGLDR